MSRCRAAAVSVGRSTRRLRVDEQCERSSLSTRRHTDLDLG
ncbi:hypothetical protein Pd630_LPD07068 [Rhodococcus opacus PD630]|nr:hypothetical protein Pd630_LPD07068 [Rhodococcus opacus PD630]